MQKRIPRRQVEFLLRSLSDNVEDYKLVSHERLDNVFTTIRYTYSVCVYDKTGRLLRTVCNNTSLKKIYEYITLVNNKANETACKSAEV